MELVATPKRALSVEVLMNDSKEITTAKETKAKESVAPEVTTEALAATLDTRILPTPYNTVVIGAGPIGLMAAICALKHAEGGEKVAIVADRIEELGVRQQVLWIQEDVFAFIKDIAGARVVQKYIEDLSITEDPDEGYYSEFKFK